MKSTFEGGTGGGAAKAAADKASGVVVQHMGQPERELYPDDFISRYHWRGCSRRVVGCSKMALSCSRFFIKSLIFK